MINDELADSRYFLRRQRELCLRLTKHVREDPHDLHVQMQKKRVHQIIKFEFMAIATDKQFVY